jgi:hypothetical protein
MPHEDCLFIRLEDFFAARRGGEPGEDRGDPGPAASARDAPPEARGRPERGDAVMPTRALRAAASARP